MKIADLLPEETLSRIEAAEPDAGAKDFRLVEAVRAKFKPRAVEIEIPKSEFPEIIVHAPKEWPCVHFAPLYDVHKGHRQHDAAMFARHKKWLLSTPNVLTANGGDMIEFANKLSVGAGVYEQDYDPENQLVKAALDLAGLHHKMLWALPGNHEDRSRILGISVSKWLAWLLDVPHFPDFVMMTIKFRGNNFRILAHHGSGGANTPGGQVMAARKDLSWAKIFDIYWTGHLHAGRVDVLYQTDVDQRTGRIYERNGLVIISPSYLKYFDTYAATKRYIPGARGLSVITFQPDGRIDAELHAQGRRL